MSDRAPIRILVVDDHQLIRVGISTLILPESDMKVVGEASNGLRGHRQIPGMPPGRHIDGPADAGNERFRCDRGDS